MDSQTTLRTDQTIQMHDKYFKPYISSEKIQTIVADLAQQVSRDFEGKRPLFIVVLNGGFMFAVDFFKSVTIDAEITFIKTKSYEGTQSTGKVLTLIGLSEDLKDRSVVILEDIVGTGHTLSDLLKTLHNHQPKEIKIATLLLKPAALQHSLKCDYIGLEIPNEFVVGYGLDYDGLGRNYKDIYQLKL